MPGRERLSWVGGALFPPAEVVSKMGGGCEPPYKWAGAQWWHENNSQV
jgi:hypothetical protein